MGDRRETWHLSAVLVSMVGDSEHKNCRGRVLSYHCSGGYPSACATAILAQQPHTPTLDTVSKSERLGSSHRAASV